MDEGDAWYPGRWEWQWQTINTSPVRSRSCSWEGYNVRVTLVSLGPIDEQSLYVVQHNIVCLSNVSNPVLVWKLYEHLFGFA